MIRTLLNREMNFRAVSVWSLVVAMVLAPGLSDRGFVTIFARSTAQAQTISTSIYTYDNNGNVLSRSTGNQTDTFTYDAENRLISANMQSGATPGLVTYSYDDDGLRIGKTDSGTTTAFLFDKNRNYAQVVVERKGSAFTNYNYGNGLISQTSSGVGTRFYLADGHFSTRQLTTSAGLVSDTYTYDGFGDLLAATGLTPNNYRYTGEQFDPNLGWYYLRARYYDPARGRFSTTDPFEGNIFVPMSLHRYLYANADPVNSLDPSGKFAVPVALAGVFAVLGIIDLIGAGIGYLDSLPSVRFFAKKQIAGNTDKFLLRFCSGWQVGVGYGLGWQDAIIAEDPSSVKDPLAMKYSLFFHGATPGASLTHETGTGTLNFSSTPAADSITKRKSPQINRRLEDFVGEGTYYTALGATAFAAGGTFANLHILPEGSSVWLSPSISPKAGLGFEIASVQQVDWAQKTKGPLANFKLGNMLDCAAK